MAAKLFVKCILLFFILITIACGGLRYSQVAPEAATFHPKKIAVFPVEVGGNNEEARGPVEQVVAGALAEKKWFSDIVDAESLNRQLSANVELRKVMTDYLTKLRMVNFSDPDLSKKIGESANVDAFLLVSVDLWSYTVEKGDKVAKVGLCMTLYEASSGKFMWRVCHDIADSYIMIKPDLPDVARRVARKMIDEMPH